MSSLEKILILVAVGIAGASLLAAFNGNHLSAIHSLLMAIFFVLIATAIR